MDLWTFNKLAAAVLASLLVIVGANTAVEVLYPTGGPGEYTVVEVEQDTQTAGMTGTGTGSEAEAETVQPLPARLAAADPASGEQTARQCSACHVFEEGGANRVGPNLYGVVGREVASVEDFSYSGALQEYGGEWTYERLDCFLENPSECVEGTSMAYAGIKDPNKRADMIAYLASLGEAPPFPEAEAAAQDATADPAEETAQADQAAETEPEEMQESAADEAASQAQAEDAPEADAQQADAQEASENQAAKEEATRTAEATGDAAETDASTQANQASESAGDAQLAELLAAGDAAAGEQAVRVCSACHTFDEGGGNRVGPNLYGVAGREVASVDGFNYSQALKDYGGEWTYERLNCYLKNPRECVPGNKMTYAGVKDDGKRADIIAYLASLGDAPPMPGDQQDTGKADKAEDSAEVGQDGSDATRAASLRGGLRDTR